MSFRRAAAAAVRLVNPQRKRERAVGLAVDDAPSDAVVGGVWIDPASVRFLPSSRQRTMYLPRFFS
jgi:hypothetical protein